MYVDWTIRPDLRQALVRDGAQGDPDNLGTQMLGRLNVNWERRDGPDTVASMCVLNVVQQQAEREGFWDVDKGFHARHSSYSRETHDA
jgi:hypothetical protein